jgi:hypothetical protein
MKLPIKHLGIYIDHNIWYEISENEPMYMVYTPDVERYANTIEDARLICEVFTRKNGRVEFYNKRMENELF